MRRDIKELLKPEILNTIDGLELVSKIVVNSYFTGSKNNQKVGIGQEFSQYRSYEVGDDPRLLDWKMYARSERYYVRQAEIESNIGIRFFLDASASMLHEDSSGLKKIDFARLLVASLAHLARKQGDEIALFVLNNDIRMELQSGFSLSHFQRFLYQLLQVEPSGVWPLMPTHNLGNRDRELIVFVSDLYERSDELLSFIKGLKTKRNEVIVLHLMADNELSFDFDKSASFKDLESGEKVEVSDSMKESYLQRVRGHIADIKRGLMETEVDYSLFNTSYNMGELLKKYLKRRKELL